MPIHPLSNFDFDSYYSGNRFYGGTFSRDNLPATIDDKFYIINLETRFESGSHWVMVYNVEMTCYYFDSFGIDPAEEILNFMKTGRKRVIMNTYRIQDVNSILCGYFCVYFIDELLKGKKFQSILLEFSPSNYKQNDEIIKTKLHLI